MKISLVTSNRESQYTVALLNKLGNKHGFEWVEPEEADLVFCSVCDLDDLPKLKKARKMAGDKPLIMGGMEAFAGSCWLAWADYVWVGEGFEFFEALKNQDWNNFINHPAMFHKDKLEALPSRRIDWQDVPLVKTGKRNWYYMAGRGCSGVCPFCYTKWQHQYQVAPQSLLDEVLRTLNRMEGNNRLHWISNDNLKLPVSARVVNPSIRIRDYLKNPMAHKGATSFHFGIERFSEAGRKEWKKPISNEEISKCIAVLKELRKEAEFFFIIGLPSSVEESKEFLSIIPVNAQNYPCIYTKLTYFDPSPHTPLQRWDMNQLTPFTEYNPFLFSLIGTNKAFRLYPVRAMARAAWRTFFRRCNFEEVVRLGPDPGAKMDMQGLIQHLKGNGLTHVIDGQQKTLPWEGIDCGNGKR